MSKTIYGNVTKNGIDVADMVDENHDIIYRINEDYFVRITSWRDDSGELKGTALAAFADKDEWTAIYAEKVPDEVLADFDENSDWVDVSNAITDAMLDDFKTNFLKFAEEHSFDTEQSEHEV